MTQILVYGDSLIWGIVPETRTRWPFSAALIAGEALVAVVIPILVTIGLMQLPS
jgi:lysophospholipase L1-like esterase